MTPDPWWERQRFFAMAPPYSWSQHNEQHIDLAVAFLGIVLLEVLLITLKAGVHWPAAR